MGQEGIFVLTCIFTSQSLHGVGRYNCPDLTSLTQFVHGVGRCNIVLTYLSLIQSVHGLRRYNCPDLPVVDSVRAWIKKV